MITFVTCKGLCGPDACTDVPWADGPCPSLKEGRCAIYKDRPLVCRLWGSVPEMPCPHGCEPTLTSVEGLRLMVTALLRLKEKT